jgi:ABC-type amino acid transport system, permease component
MFSRLDFTGERLSESFLSHQTQFDAISAYAATLWILVGVVGIAKLVGLARCTWLYRNVRNTPLLLQIMFWNFAVFLPSLLREKLH